VSANCPPALIGIKVQILYSGHRSCHSKRNQITAATDRQIQITQQPRKTSAKLNRCSKKSGKPKYNLKNSQTITVLFFVFFPDRHCNNTLFHHFSSTALLYQFYLQNSSLTSELQKSVTLSFFRPANQNERNNLHLPSYYLLRPSFKFYSEPIFYLQNPSFNFCTLSLKNSFLSSHSQISNRRQPKQALTLIFIHLL